MGELVEISGSDLHLGSWRHHAFIPVPLGEEEPQLSGTTYRTMRRRVGRSQLLMLRRGDFPTRTCFGRRRCVEKRSPHQRSRGHTPRSTRYSRRTTIYQRPLR